MSRRLPPGWIAAAFWCGRLAERTRPYAPHLAASFARSAQIYLDRGMGWRS